MVDIKRLLETLGMNQKELSEVLGVSAQSITNVKKGKMAMPETWIKLINERYKLDVYQYISSENRPDNASGGGNISINNEKITVKKLNEGIQVMTKQEYRLVPVVSKLAYASYSESWADEEFIEAMEKIPTMQLEDGNYLWFEIKGDSMMRSEGDSISEGDFVLARELYKHHWNALQLRRMNIWVINHREQGLMIKEIVKQNGNIITCRSWNPLVTPQEFLLDLKDVNQLFYFKEVRKTRLS